MPNRILKESICTSPNIDQLPPQAETFFYRLIVNCDDYGRIDGRASILRAKCFPLKLDTVKDKDIEAWLTQMSSLKLLNRYSVNSGSYIQITTWDQHQQIRAKRSKYPPPDSRDTQSDNNGNHLIADDSRCTRNPIQSNPNPNNIYVHWNEQKIRVHKKLTPDIANAISKSLKIHNEEEICRVIQNYAEIVNHPESYWFGYKWTLKDFLTRGFDKFEDMEIARTNYKKDGGQNGTNQRYSKQGGTKLPDRDTGYTPAPPDPELDALVARDIAAQGA